MATEMWKDVPGYEGFYQVSNFGKVRSLDRKRLVKTKYGSFTVRFDQGKELMGMDNGNGYLAVNLRKNGERKLCYIHRLVAEAFIPKKDGCNTINHLDHNRANNVFTNLEWCTQGENVRYSQALMRREKSVCAQSNTGEKYICRMIKRGKQVFRVTIKNRGVCRYFKKLEDAIAYRNGVIGNV